MANLILNIERLSKRYSDSERNHVVALDAVDLDIQAGEFVTVLGPSGCGKTTLLRSIAGFEMPDTGSITIDGKRIVGDDVRTVGAHDRGVGIVPQEGALFPHLSVAENVAFGLRHLRRRERNQRVDEVLNLVGLVHTKKRRPHELSGGQQQRIALARALAPKPRIILLDEPFSALDAHLRDNIRLSVREILRELGTTALLVTHDQQEALSLGDRVAIMRSGKIVQFSDPRDAYYYARDLDLAQFLGETVIVEGEVESNEGLAEQAQSGEVLPCRVSCAFGNLPVANWHGACGACRVMIRPENIRVSEAPITNELNATSSTGVLGTIVDQTFYGRDRTLRVRVDAMKEDILVRVSGDQSFQSGDQVQLIVDKAVSTYEPGQSSTSSSTSN